jgi:hypothetical protein
MDSMQDQTPRQLLPKVGGGNMFRIKTHESPESREAGHYAISDYEGQAGHRSHHFLAAIRNCILDHLKHHRADAAPAGEGGTLTTAWRAEQWTSDCDRLAVLGLLDPGSRQPDDRYGLAGLSGEEALGALALQGFSAGNVRSITRLSPQESLAAFGLLHAEGVA